MLFQHISNRMKVAAIAFIAGLILYLSFILFDEYFDAHQVNCNTGLAPCLLGIEGLFILFLGWLSGVILMVSLFELLKIPKWPSVLYTGVIAVPLIAWLLVSFTSIWGSWIFLILYPVIYSGLYLMLGEE